MSMAAGAVTASATASRREEEEMSAYTRIDLDEGWEFKFSGLRLESFEILSGCRRS
jgi:hypothetical protein